MQVWNVFFNVLNDILPIDARITPNEVFKSLYLSHSCVGN